ncbi:MAG: hypothetical protein CBD74_06480 [Saprospirales bacterium TMED214]|nr:MAG: hypothetical protein CBD74_06480 [Saprospirales bacterium TMED214]
MVGHGQRPKGIGFESMAVLRIRQTFFIMEAAVERSHPPFVRHLDHSQQRGIDATNANPTRSITKHHRTRFVRKSSEKRAHSSTSPQ